MNLHKIGVQTDGNETVAQQDYSINNERASIQVYFKDLENHLIKHIEEADVVVGCVAWLTSKPILKALALKDAVAIVIQKEDFLKPDINAKKGWKDKLHKLYWSLPHGLERHDKILKDLDTTLFDMSCCGDPGIESVRCVGNHNSEEIISFPRSHHKFLIFCKNKNRNDEYNPSIKWKPYKIWTGSYNLTQNANMSFENAIVLNNKSIIKAYFQEWAQIEALSEPLEWGSKWCKPEWRIGT